MENNSADVACFDESRSDPDVGHVRHPAGGIQDLLDRWLSNIRTVVVVWEDGEGEPETRGGA